MEKLIIFADYGLDDAAATASIFRSKEKFESVTVVPIGGNVPTEVSHRNCITLLNALSVKNVTVVDTRKESQPFEYLSDIHGKDGMGDILKATNQTENFNIIDFCDWIETLSGDETLLSLGPMTLVEKVLKKYKTNKLILMGGCIKEKPNYKGYEFNHGLDPKAFSECVKYPHVAITLDTCSVDALNMHDYEIFGNDLYTIILNRSKELSAKRNEEGCYVYDDIAACYLIYPDRFTLENCKDPFGNTVTNAVYNSELAQFEK